jgi:4-amino-4-deoxy-L-arabinose transferase-like glycosyltransferase
MFTWALYRSLLAADNPSYKNILIAGLAAGLSMAVKFNGAFAAIAVVLAVFAGQRELSVAQRLFSFRMLAALCVIPFGHFLASPFFYISFPEALEEIRQLRAMHASETFAMLRYLKGLVTGYFGIPAGALCLAGFCRLMITRDNRVRILLVTTVALLIFISLHSYADPRYIFQVFPVFAVAGAVLIKEILSPVKSRMLTVLVWGALLIHPLYQTAVWNIDHSRPSITLEAKAWIEENIPVNAKILIDNAGNKGPKLETSLANLRAQYERARRHGLLKADYLALKLEVEPRIYYRLYEVADPAGSRDDDYRKFCLWADLEEIGHPPEYYRERGFDYIVVTKRFFNVMNHAGFVPVQEFRDRKRAIRIDAIH